MPTCWTTANEHGSSQAAWGHRINKGMDDLPEQKSIELVPMTEHDMEELVRLAREMFKTDEDPTQGRPSVERYKAIQKIDPYALLVRKQDGKIVGWSGVVPTSKQSCDDFIAAKVTEEDIISKAIDAPGFESIYLWMAATLPEYRRRGEALSFMKAQIQKIIERHPTITEFYGYGWSPAGARMVERIEKDLGIQIKRPPYCLSADQLSE